MTYNYRVRRQKFSTKLLKLTGSRARLAAVLGVVVVIVIAAVAAAHLAAPKTNPVKHNPLFSMPKSVLKQPAAAPGENHALGIAAGSSLPSLSPAQASARMQAIAATGATWVRFDFDWSQIQPDSAKQFDWQTIDQLVADAQKYHLRVLATLSYTPGWARNHACSDSDKCFPASPAAFAQFAAAAAQRYQSKGVHDWEIWNEPNNPSFWQPGANPADYVDLLKQTYAALHKQDAGAVVITGGLSPQATSSTAYSPIDFLSKVYASGGRGYFDAVGNHPYTFPLTPASAANDAWTQMASNSKSLRSIMKDQGDGQKQIWLTEFGAPTGGPGPVASIDNPNLAAHPYVVDEALQAKNLSDAIALYDTYQWAGPLFYYSYQDAGTTPDTNENFFGLVRADGSHKPAYATFSQAAGQLKNN